MRSRLPIIAFYVVIFLLVLLSIAVAYKLVFVPPCTPTKDIPCPATDAGSIAGVAATVMGVAATVLAFLGAFAVAVWWNQLDERVNKQVTDFFKKDVAPQVKALESTIAEGIYPLIDSWCQNIPKSIFYLLICLFSHLFIYPFV